MVSEAVAEPEPAPQPAETAETERPPAPDVSQEGSQAADDLLDILPFLGGLSLVSLVPFEDEF